MPHLLTIPFKSTSLASIRSAVREYIHINHSDTHPDHFKSDITAWEKLRREATSNVTHVDQIDILIKYNAQLSFILIKFPSDISLEFAYKPAFDPRGTSISLPSILYEQACTLFNLASLYSQLATPPPDQKLSNPLLVQSVNYYQAAAGSIDHLYELLKPLKDSLSASESLPLEFDENVLLGIRELMLAQAQECVFHKAISEGKYKASILARIAIKSANLYTSSLTHFTSSPSSFLSTLPSTFIPLIQVKSHHLLSLAHLHQSTSDISSKPPLHASEQTRLSLSLQLSKKSLSIAQKQKLHPRLITELQELVESLGENWSRSKRDNEYVYNVSPLPEGRLAEIAETALVKSVVPEGVKDVKGVLAGSEVCFGELMGWGAKMAIEIYNTRKEDLIREDIKDRISSFDQLQIKTLRSLNLPASLEALSTRVGLPPSLLAKAQEVRLEHGIEYLRRLSEDCTRLFERCQSLLNEGLDILDSEVTEDEQYRLALQGDNLAHTERPPSSIANVSLTSRAEQYQASLQEAQISDTRIAEKIDDKEEDISLLEMDAEALDRIVPSTTPNTRHSPLTSPNRTQTHARALQSLLEHLDRLKESREMILQRAERMSVEDDIDLRVKREAEGMEMYMNLEPVMFEGVMEESLRRYDRVRREVDDCENAVHDVLERVKEENEMFLQSRREDVSVRAREGMLRNLETTYFDYVDLRDHFIAAVQYYNEMAGLISELREECKVFERSRRNEIKWLSDYMNEMSLNPSHPPSLSQHHHAEPLSDPQFHEPSISVAVEAKPSISINTSTNATPRVEAQEPLFLPSPSPPHQSTSLQMHDAPAASSYEAHETNSTPARPTFVPPPPSSLPRPSFAPPSPAAGGAGGAGQRAWLPPPSGAPNSAEWKSLRMPVVPRGGMSDSGSATVTLTPKKEKGKGKKRVGVEQ